MEIALAKPDITSKEIEAVLDVLKTPVLSIGPQVQAFEDLVAAYVGVQYGVAVNSGTSGLHLLVRSLGIKAGDEVITTPFSFVASSNCILFEGGTPVFADIDPESLNLDPAQIEAKITTRTKALLPVHVFGRTADMKAIMDIARRHNLKVIEDSCEALGADLGEKKAGALGNGAVFAFYPNKQITTGEGGMIVTDDPEIAANCRSMRNQGRSANPMWLEHERIGFNYRMDEISAALGNAQMHRLEEILAKRAGVARKYHQKLAGIPGLLLPNGGLPVQNSWFVYVLRFMPPLDRDVIAAYLKNEGVQCRPYFPPIHLQEFYQKEFGYKGGEYPVTEKIAKQTLAIPFYNDLSDFEIDYVVEKIREAVRKFG